MTTITRYEAYDLRYPTSLTGDGTDATNRDCDYSSAMVILYTDGDDVGYAGGTSDIRRHAHICL